MTKEERVKAIWDEIGILFPSSFYSSEDWVTYIKEKCPLLTALVEGIKVD